MRKGSCLVCAILAAALVIAISACSAFYTEHASIALELPGASSARSISVNGAPPHTSSGQIEAYEIRVRNSSNEMVQKVTGAAPGSTIVIDELYPDTYKISVLAYHTRGQNFDGVYTTYDWITYYGITEVEVSAGEEKSAEVALKNLDDPDSDPAGSYPYLSLHGDESIFSSGNLYFSCTVTGNDVNFFFTGEQTGGAGTTGTMVPSNLNGIADFWWYYVRETFLEPGFSYTFNVTVRKTPSGASEPTETYRGSVTAVVEHSNYAHQTEHAIDVYVQ